MKLLRSPDAPAPGSPPNPQETQQAPPPNPPGAPSGGPAAPPLERPSGAPPGAAQTVLEGKKTERELALENQLKATQTRTAELEDENRRLKSVSAPPTPKKKKHWLDGGTFFHDDGQDQG